MVVNTAVGLHARPGSLLAKTAGHFQAQVRVCKGEKEVDGKRLLGLMTLGGAKKGDLITLKADGPDETEALLALKELFDNNFGEG